MMKLRSLVLVLCIVFASVFTGFAQEEMMMDMAGAPASLLSATDMDGAPEGVDTEAWMNASAIAFFDMAEDGTDTVTVVATGLVADGLYTFWWVNNMEDMANMSMGAAGGAEENAFTADEKGNATFSVVVASDNDYQTLVVAYHADGETHGEMPGEMGVQTFSHLMGAFPGPANMDTLGYVSFLVSTAMDGAPEGFEEEPWLEATGYAYVSAEMMEDQSEVTVLLTGLAPEGLYTFWWVNGMADMATMTMGPAGGAEENAFTADENGTAVVKVSVVADNDYETLVVAYHADGETHGEMPGEMGVQTFSHLMGGFPHLMMSDGM